MFQKMCFEEEEIERRRNEIKNIERRETKEGKRE